VTWERVIFRTFIIRGCIAVRKCQTSADISEKVVDMQSQTNSFFAQRLLANWKPLPSLAIKCVKYGFIMCDEN
jgi:hypothetical protein